MWRELTRHLTRYETAVVALVDDRGYPSSFRCRAVPDATQRVIAIEDVPSSVRLRAGRAGLLCHTHDENLWRMRSFISRGRIEERSGGWVYVPETFTPGMSLNPIRLFRMMRQGERTAASYLARRGWERPETDWELIGRIKREVHG